MIKSTHHYVTTFFIVLLALIVGTQCYAGANAIKERMDERLPVIVNLKSNDIIGENNKGYVDFVPKAAKEKEDIVNAENSDRRKIYSAIAKQEKISVEEVEKIRAKSIANRAKSGEWLQNAAGKWYRK